MYVWYNLGTEQAVIGASVPFVLKSANELLMLKSLQNCEVSHSIYVIPFVDRDSKNGGSYPKFVFEGTVA